jgi:hypothetical protein
MDRKIRFRKKENEPSVVRKLYVSLDRAEDVIEGGPPIRTAFEFSGPAALCGFRKECGFLLALGLPHSVSTVL